MATAAPMHAPPGWGTDPLTAFMKQAGENAWATFVQPGTRIWFERARDIDTVFEQAIDLMSGQTPNFVEALMLVNACGAYRSAVQLAMEAKSCETYALIRSCMEYSLLATFMHRHPEVIEIWMRRGESEDQRRLVRRTFVSGTMLAELDAMNNAVGERVRDMYELAIDFGAHPNEQGFFGRLEMRREGNNVNFEVKLLGDGEFVAPILRNAAQSGLIALEAFRLIYRERFDIMGVTERIEGLKNGL